MFSTLSQVYDRAYDWLTVRRDENERKLMRMSTFAGYLVNFVFLQVAWHLVIRGVGSELSWKGFWLIVLWFGLTLFLLVFLFRVGMMVQFFLTDFIKPRNPGPAVFSVFGFGRWFATATLNILFWVAMWNISSAISSGLSMVAKAQLPAEERKEPRREPERPPSCPGDFCIATIASTLELR